MTVAEVANCQTGTAKGFNVKLTNYDSGLKRDCI